MIIIADNLTISNPLIYKNLQSKNRKFFYNFFEHCQKYCDYIDINLGQVKKNIPEIVKFIFKILYDVNNFKIVIDTINKETIIECLKYCKEAPILNSFSMDEEKIKNIAPIARSNNLDIVALVMDSFIPVELDKKIILATELVNRLNENGVPNNKIILDPVVAPLGWENGAVYNKNNLEFLKLIKEALSPDIRTMMGLSNLTTTSTGENRSVKDLDAYYLCMAYSNCIDFALVNIFNKNMLNAIKFTKILECKIIFAISEFNE